MLIPFLIIKDFCLNQYSNRVILWQYSYRNNTENIMLIIIENTNPPSYDGDICVSENGEDINKKNPILF